MKTNKQIHAEVEKVIGREIAEGGFEGEHRIEAGNFKPCFQAGIDSVELRHIFFEYNPEYEKHSPGKIVRVMQDIARHEINHKGYRGFEGCPRTNDKHVEKFFEPIANVLAPKGYTGNDFHYNANCLEDSVLHADLSREFSLDGMVSFFADVGSHLEQQQFTPFYDAHVKLNLFLFGNKKQKKEVRKYFTKDKETQEKVKEVVQNFLQRTGLKELRADRRAMREFLNNEENWPNVARIYAEEFSKLMQPSYALPIPNHSGRGTKGREAEKTNGSNETEGNEFDREMETPEFKKGRIQRAYENGESAPVWISRFEALDLSYQSLAQKLTIKAETFARQTQRPIFWYGTRELNDRDNLKHLAFGFNDSGKIELRKRRWHEDTTVPYKETPRGFPETRFCLFDCSGTMGLNPQGGVDVGSKLIIPWGNKSRYHYLLLGWYGYLEYLKQNHLLSQTGISLCSYSDTSRVKSGLDAAKELALDPQFGSTVLDEEAIEKAFEGRDKLILSTSDGKIDNWNSETKDKSTIGRKFVEGAKKHYTVHLQVGKDTPASRDMKSAGLYVEPVMDASFFANRIIDITDRIYRGGRAR